MRSFKVLCSLFCLAVLCLIGGCQETSSNQDAIFSKGLLPVQNDGTWGYINAKNEYKIPAQYEDAKPFAANGLAAVSLGGTWGYINTNGEMVIEAAYSEAETFQGDLAIVKSEGLYGYINAKGETVIPAMYQEAFPFAKNDLARVCADGQYGYINKSGDWVIDPQYQAAADFSSNGLAAVVLEEKAGYIDASGKIVIEPAFEEAGTFTDNGLAVATEDGSLYGYINAQGEWVITPQYDAAADFSEGIAIVTKNNTTYGIDEEGETLFSFSDEFAVDSFHDGKAWCYNESSGYGGYIDTEGNQVIAEQFKAQLDASLSRFGTDHYAVVRIGDYYGVADTEGKFIINPQYEAIGQVEDTKKGIYADSALQRLFKNGIARFMRKTRDGQYVGYVYQNEDGSKSIYVENGLLPGENGLTAVSLDGVLWGYINQNCEIEIAPQWQYASNFELGYAYVETENGYNYIDEEGNIIDVGSYTFASDFTEDGIAVVVKNEDSNWSFLNKDGSLMELSIPVNGDYSFEWLANGYVMLGTTVVDSEGESVFKVEEGEYILSSEKDKIITDSGKMFDTTDGTSKTLFSDNMVIEEYYTDDEMMIISNHDSENPLYGLVDFEGNFILEPEYENIGRLTGGGVYRAIVSEEKEIYRVIREDGSLICEINGSWLARPLFYPVVFTENGYIDLKTKEYVEGESNSYSYDEDGMYYTINWEGPGFEAHIEYQGSSPTGSNICHIKANGGEVYKYTLSWNSQEEMQAFYNNFEEKFINWPGTVLYFSNIRNIFFPGPGDTWWFIEPNGMQLITAEGDVPFKGKIVDKVFTYLRAYTLNWAYVDNQWNYINEDGEVVICQSVWGGDTNDPLLWEEDGLVYLCTQDGMGEVYDQDGNLLAEWDCVVE